MRNKNGNCNPLIIFVFYYLSALTPLWLQITEYIFAGKSVHVLGVAMHLVAACHFRVINQLVIEARQTIEVTLLQTRLVLQLK